MRKNHLAIPTIVFLAALLITSSAQAQVQLGAGIQLDQKGGEQAQFLSLVLFDKLVLRYAGTPGQLLSNAPEKEFGLFFRERMMRVPLWRFDFRAYLMGGMSLHSIDSALEQALAPALDVRGQLIVGVDTPVGKIDLFGDFACQLTIQDSGREPTDGFTADNVSCSDQYALGVAVDPFEVIKKTGRGVKRGSSWTFRGLKRLFR